ncbi:MAG: ATP-binding protein, partial [Synergistaceae bacterium]|nr:ATP-binding protein [Synergistaceae bacterium]
NFIKIEFGRIGADTNITPREVIRDFIEVLNIVHQNPGTNVPELLGLQTFSYAKPELQDDESLEKEFEEFEL